MAPALAPASAIRSGKTFAILAVASPVLGRFPTPPDRAFVQGFLAHLATTDRPEDFPGIELHSRPPKEGEHRILCKVDVTDRRRRSGERIPCATCCEEHGKWFEGRLLWSSDGSLRLVGHVCARRYIGAVVYDGLERDREREQQKIANEDFLLANVGALPDCLVDFSNFAPVCAELERLHSKLHADAPSLMKRIGSAFREHGGYATVRQRRSSDGPAGFRSSTGEESEFEEVQLALLVGEPMTNPHFRPNAAHARLRRRLVALLGGREGKLSDAALSDVLGEMSATDEKLSESAKEIRALSRDAVRLFEHLMEARRFFTRDNLAALRAWGAEPRNDDPFVVNELVGNVTFRDMDDDDHATIAMPSARIPMVIRFDRIKDG